MAIRFNRKNNVNELKYNGNVITFKIYVVRMLKFVINSELLFPF